MGGQPWSHGKSKARTVSRVLLSSYKDWAGEFTHVVSRVRLIFAIMPREGSTLACMDDITPTTTINQLEGLAGKTPVIMPFWKDTQAINSILLRPLSLHYNSPGTAGSWDSRSREVWHASHQEPASRAETLPGATTASPSCSLFFPNF